MTDEPAHEQGQLATVHERSMAVQIRGLAKRFGPVLAVTGVDLDVPRGRFFGLVGPNGAGKTTILSMVTGLLRPDAGAARVDGIDVWAQPRSRQVAGGPRGGAAQRSACRLGRAAGAHVRQRRPGWL